MGRTLVPLSDTLPDACLMLEPYYGLVSCVWEFGSYRISSDTVENGITLSESGLTSNLTVK